MKKLSIFAICALCALGTDVFAQGKQIVKVPKAADLAAKAARQSAAAAVKVPAVPKVPSVQTPPVVPAHPRVAAFVSQHPRTLVGLQKMVGFSTRQAWSNLKRLGAEYTPKNPRPQLQEENAFTAADLTEFAVPNAPGQTMPEFPFQNQRGLIYRGLALDTDGPAIRNILENGLLIKDLGKYAADYITSLGAEVVKAPIKATKITNLTANPSEAVMWAKLRSAEGQIQVVMVVKYTSNKSSFSNSQHAISTSKDIPPEEIYAMTALLDLNGTLTWCKLELEGAGFRITPYEPFTEPPQP